LVAYQNCVRGQLIFGSDFSLAHSVTACKITDCQRLIDRLTSFLPIYLHSGINEERLEFIPTYGTMTTFPEADNLLKGCQVPLKIVYSLQLLHHASNRLCEKPMENFGSNFAVFIALIQQEVLVTKNTAGAHFKTCNFRLRYSCQIKYHREFFVLVDIYNEFEDISHNNVILLLPCKRLS
jgi:hypothetical protein